LFDEAPSDPPNAFDRRFRWACDLYNRGLERALLRDDPRGVDFGGVPTKLPVGSIAIELDRTHVPWDEHELGRLILADDFEVFGLSLRYRHSGLGVPLIGLASDADPTSDAAAKFVGERSGLPVTAFLRIQGGIDALERGVQATLELHSGFDLPETKVGQKLVPLESDQSAPLAYSLHQNRAVWDFSVSGFFGKSLLDRNRLVMTRPYQRGRIPIVFVHGTASSPAYWAEMFNTLQADPVLRDSTQFWFFIYETGNPIAYSAATLRDSLAEAIQTFDPNGEDAALRHMVVIGHSQGGLLARLLVTQSSVEWVKDMTGSSIEELGLKEDQQKLVRWAIDRPPMPGVERVIFISTPHRGSFLADSWFARTISKTIAVPGELLDISETVAASQRNMPEGLRFKRVSTSLDNMDAANPFLKRLGEAPIAPNVTAHSIIARKGKKPLEESNDGVVAYQSAHIEGVESEFSVASGHSCQSHPLAIREVRRILVEHVKSRPKP
jgi:pimeloyl-ACP methyl ester carboxylesterase